MVTFGYFIENNGQQASKLIKIRAGRSRLFELAARVLTFKVVLFK